jgi:hypothetical protein
MRKRLRWILAALAVLAAVLAVVYVYFTLFYLPGQEQLVEEFNKNEAHFAQAVEFLQGSLGGRTLIGRENYKDYNNDDLKFIFEKLHYKSVLFSSADYIAFYRGSTFGRATSVWISYVANGGEAFIPQGELVENIKDNWFYVSRWL